MLAKQSRHQKPSAKLQIFWTMYPDDNDVIVWNSPRGSILVSNFHSCRLQTKQKQNSTRTWNMVYIWELWR